MRRASLHKGQEGDLGDLGCLGSGWNDLIIRDSSFDLISESPEKRQKIENVETVFFTNAGEERNDQKCVIALCENPVLSKEGEPWKDLYVAFRGTDVDDYKDVLTGN